MHSRFLSALALASLAGPASALDFGSGFSVTGDVQLEYLSSGGSNASFAFADVTLGWRSQASGAFGFGFDINPVVVSSDELTPDFSTFWGGLVLTTTVGEVTVGNPRPLLKTMIKAPELGGSRTFDLEFEQIAGSVTESVALLNDEQFYGISFKGSSGALGYGVAYHTVDGADVDIVELAATYQLGSTLIQGAVEKIDVLGTSLEKLLIGATYAADRWSAGVLLTAADQGGADYQFVQLFGDYAISDAFKVGAQVTAVNGFGSDSTLYGISGEYGFGSGGFAKLGAFGSDNGGDTTYSASVGYRF